VYSFATEFVCTMAAVLYASSSDGNRYACDSRTPNSSGLPRCQQRFRSRSRAGHRRHAARRFPHSCGVLAHPLGVCLSLGNYAYCRIRRSYAAPAPARAGRSAQSLPASNSPSQVSASRASPRVKRDLNRGPCRDEDACSSVHAHRCGRSAPRDSHASKAALSRTYSAGSWSAWGLARSGHHR
jgi:hypothetical protein